MPEEIITQDEPVELVEEVKLVVTQSRWRSPYLWAAFVALVAFILGNWGIYDVIGLNDESFKRLADLVLAALTALGVYNSPTDKENF